MVTGADRLGRIFYTYEVMWHQQGGRTAIGSVPGVDKPVYASVNTKAIPVVGEDGSEITAVATVCWNPHDGVPKIGDHVTIPQRFGVKPRREVISAQLADSGIPWCPNHVEVRLR